MGAQQGKHSQDDRSRAATPKRRTEPTIAEVEGFMDDEGTAPDDTATGGDRATTGQHDHEHGHEHDEHEVQGHHHLPAADLVAGTYDQDRQRRAAKDRQVKEARDVDQPSGGGLLGRLRDRGTS